MPRHVNTTKTKSEGQPLLYLDFDGVLGHENCHWSPELGFYLEAPERYRLFQHADLLQEMLEPYPAIQIVLTTSWVRIVSCAEAAARLPAGLRTRVIAATYSDAPADFAYLARGEQVTEDVLLRKPSQWLALDDDGRGWPAWALSHYVQTHPYEGISPKRIQAEIRRRLNVLCEKQP